MESSLPRAARTGAAPGRAAGANEAGRFERHAREAVDDGWDREEDLPPLRTQVAEERPRRAVTRNDSPDIGFDRSINPYRGCEHGCIYCFARPTHAFLGMSPGLDFETRLVAKEGIAEALERDLRRPGYRPRRVAIGTATDPYQPEEAKRGLMRDVLEVMGRFGHPATITTRGATIERDLDLLGPLAERGLVRVAISVTTLDRALARAMEPRAPVPKRRLQAIEALDRAGVPVMISASPMIPALTDHELEAILGAAREAGAVAASCIPLRLPGEVAPLFRQWVEEHRPDAAKRIMGRVNELHGGRDYDPDFGKRMTGQGVWARLLRRRFDVAVARLGLSDGWGGDLRADQFGVPLGTREQPSLF
ncbi:PA0069 family radical SAM protein [Hasllibacter halocynthiae]|nr:PA0069 family radical SAM protein [Hasllibacter halocynthiae]